MQDRPDLYGPVHKGLRHAMNACLLKLGQLDPSDAVDVSAGLAELRDLLVWCEAHLEIEEHFVHAAIDRRRPGSQVSHVRHDHEGHRRDFELLRLDADALEQSVAEPPAVSLARARQLYLHFSRFVGENFAHMAFEETELNALLWELFTPDELRALLAEIIASEPAEQLMRSVRWMMPALDPATRAAILVGTRPGIPPAVFDSLLGALQPLLSERDHAKLMAAVAS